GIAFFSKKYKAQKYLAYFQSFTNTYTSFDHFKRLTEEALAVDGVCGLVIATRPDSITKEKVDYLNELGQRMYISLEFGVESTLDKSLKRINRGHDFQTTTRAFEMCRNKTFRTGAHLIIGLPGENRQDFLNHTRAINKLKPHSLKLHQLQILKNTAMAGEFKQVPDDFVTLSAKQYIQIVADFLMLLDPDIVVERFTSESPRNLVISPDWKGLKNFEFVEQLKKTMNTAGMWQGKAFKQNATH
ncbi:MAG TPA: TIGR01212 family radical SAM protein, partial [Bacteroidales bacterium]|nr:TIGR01212 family radical SAM protein [Bacteroidales bacterium]